jgi:hypothetical protein
MAALNAAIKLHPRQGGAKVNRIVVCAIVAIAVGLLVYAISLSWMQQHPPAGIEQTAP